jgi:hypothetical protein
MRIFIACPAASVARAPARWRCRLNAGDEFVGGDRAAREQFHRPFEVGPLVDAGAENLKFTQEHPLQVLWPGFGVDVDDDDGSADLHQIRGTEDGGCPG